MDAVVPQLPPITFPQLRHDALVLMHAGGAQGIAAATIPGALSDLKAALSWQVDRHLALESNREARYLLDPPLGASHVPYDVRALLTGAATAAAARARSLGMRRPGNARGRVQRLLVALYATPTAHTAMVMPGLLPAAWQEVVDLILSMAATLGSEKKWRSVATAIRNLARAATAYGVLDPRALPADCDELAALLHSWGRARIAHDVWALRSASAAIQSSLNGIPALPEWSKTRSRELKRDELSEMMPAFFADLDDWTALALKKIGNRSTTERRESALEPLRRATRERYAAQARQWADGLLALVARNAVPHPLDLASLHTGEVWLTMMPVIDAPRMTADTDARMQARRARLGVDGGVLLLPARERPLAVVVAELAVDAGDIWPRAKRVSGDLPPSITQMLFALFSIAERLSVATWGDGSEQVIALRGAWLPELKQLKGQLARATGHCKRPEKLLRVLTLPQLICGVLPWRTLIDLPRRKRAADAAASDAREAYASSAARRDASKLRTAYHDALQRWVVQATFTAEPMRVGNVSHARVGSEVLLTAQWAQDGSLVKLISISSHFPERDNAGGQVSVSSTENALPEALGTKTGEERDHWCWSRAIVDLEWADVYLRQLWQPTVVAQHPELAACSLRELVERGEFAWLINPDPRTDAAPEVEGAYRHGGIEDRFGEALLEGLRVLGRHGFPESLDEARTQFPWLFGPHIIRTLWATYWWGLRGDNGPVRKRRGGGIDAQDGKSIARRATCDTDGTLQAHYVKIRGTMIELSRSCAESFEHPRAFDAEMDSTWWHDGIVDWRARWRDQRFPIPDSLRHELAHEIQSEKRTARRTTRRRAARRAVPRLASTTEAGARPSAAVCAVTP